MSILTHGIGRFCRRVLECCLPNFCLLCGGDSDTLLCTGCEADLPQLPTTRCLQCGEPTAHGERCGRCLAKAPHFDTVTALYRYDFPADRLIHALKYGAQLPLANWFGQRLGIFLEGTSVDRIIPMPLHSSRLKERGFNQSCEIARAVGHRLGIGVDFRSCIRSRPTSSQAELPVAERAANVRGVFECASDFSGQRILLVDDVMTSGATLDECARVLKLHGAATVDAAVVARALLN